MLSGDNLGWSAGPGVSSVASYLRDLGGVIHLSGLQSSPLLWGSTPSTPTRPSRPPTSSSLFTAPGVLKWKSYSPSTNSGGFRRGALMEDSHGLV